MQITALLTTLLLTSAVAARGGDGNSIKSQCRQIEKLTKVVETANDPTLLEQKAEGNATKVEKLKAKAAEATTQLTTLQSNQTLTDACAQIFAVEDMEDDCQSINKLQKTVDIAGNQTALDLKTEGNATKAAEFQAKAATAAEKLSTLAANETLQQFCAARATASDCQKISKLQNTIDLSGNQTALEAKFEGDAEKIAAFQTKVAEATTKLQAMTSNTTLTGICSTLSNAQGKIPFIHITGNIKVRMLTKCPQHLLGRLQVARRELLLSRQR
jgi:hypothetical protein